MVVPALGCTSTHKPAIKGERERGRHITEMSAHVISVPILLNRIWLHGHTKLQERMGYLPGSPMSMSVPTDEVKNG